MWLPGKRWTSLLPCSHLGLMQEPSPLCYMQLPPSIPKCTKSLAMMSLTARAVHSQYLAITKGQRQAGPFRTRRTGFSPHGQYTRKASVHSAISEADGKEQARSRQRTLLCSDAGAAAATASGGARATRPPRWPRHPALPPRRAQRARCWPGAQRREPPAVHTATALHQLSA